MIEKLKNKTILKVSGLDKYSEMIQFWTSDGFRYDMYHGQDCCESVSVEDINGDVEDILNSRVLVSEVVTNNDNDNNKYESCTWTFYKIATIKGFLVIRWLGTSNGYYSECVDVTEHIDTQEVRDLKIIDILPS